MNNRPNLNKEQWKTVIVKVTDPALQQVLVQDYKGKNQGQLPGHFAVRVPVSPDAARHKRLVSWCEENGCVLNGHGHAVLETTPDPLQV